MELHKNGLNRFGPTALATPANAVTLLRVLGAGLLAILLLASSSRDWVLALFFVLAISDSLDGLLARRQGTTRSGAFLDPLADKILVACTLVPLAWSGSVPWLPVVLLLVREVAISIFRSYALRHGASVPASLAGKLKTFVTLVAAGLLLLQDASVQVAGLVLLWIAVVVSWGSAIDYLWRARALIERGQHADDD